VGSVGTTPTTRRGRYVFDLAKSAVAGFRIADGVVKWRTPGDYVCGDLPCAGEPQAGYDTPQNTAAQATVALRAIERGTVSYPKTNGDFNGAVSRDAHVTLEGFSPASGRALWRFDGDRNVGLIKGLLLPAQISLHTVILTDADRKLVALNLASGARHAVPATMSAWCRKLLTYRQTAGYQVPGSTIHHYVGQYALVSCEARSQHRMAPPPQVPAFVGEIGARSAGLIAWSDTAGISAEPGTHG
jgi:hypothetical protein